MQTLITFLCTSFIVLSIPFSSLKAAFQKGDAQAITEMANTKVLIEVEGKEQVYSQSQATQVLKKFFNAYPVKSFQFIFKGEETKEGVFAIGNYHSGNNKFRVTVHLKKVDAQYKIESLSIEND